jgi:hypothetical protein
VHLQFAKCTCKGFPNTVGDLSEGRKNEEIVSIRQGTQSNETRLHDVENFLARAGTCFEAEAEVPKQDQPRCFVNEWLFH